VSTTTTSLIAFAFIFGGALLGMVLRAILPEPHLSADSKDVVRLGSGLIATLAALVLGLLIASAKSAYDTQSAQIRQMTAQIILLDRFLEHYGPEAATARNLLRSSIVSLVGRIWHENIASSVKTAPFAATTTAEEFFDKIQELSPRNEAQRSFQARAIQLSSDLAQTRLLLFAQAENSIPIPFLAVLVFWLAIIFASLSLFARPNATISAALFIFAVSASGAIFLILELGQPFDGLIAISSAPLINALAPLQP
jgi:hypothetical protein